MAAFSKHRAMAYSKRNTWLGMESRYDFIFLVVIAAHRANLCKVNVGVFEKITSSLEASDVLEILASTQMIIANRDPPFIRDALVTSCW